MIRLIVWSVLLPPMFVWASRDAVAEDLIDVSSSVELDVPELTIGSPEAGKRVRITPPEYAGTEVFHTLYLPPHWRRDGERLPIIFEYTGNYFPQSGSTGEPENASLGYGLSAGRYIWVALPYINESGDDNQITWWGDEEATVDYAKRHVPVIIQEFHADPNAVFLCGFSRGAIGVNYLGLHDDEVAKLWTAFITHDHFDGVRSWGKTAWGSPLEVYRQSAAERLRRVGGRPYLVSQQGAVGAARDFIRSALEDTHNFSFQAIDVGEIFGTFPNSVAKSSHTDRWLIRPSRFREQTWRWMNEAAGVHQ